MGGLFGGSKPAPPPPPPPPPAQAVPAPTKRSEVENKMKDPKRVSRKKTIMTSPQGVLAEDGVAYKTLLGGATKKS
tara:strand:- start:7 stop:234 length:228 start_codon:yes stop_codon:yes gene_type:complete